MACASLGHELLSVSALRISISSPDWSNFIDSSEKDNVLRGKYSKNERQVQYFGWYLMAGLPKTKQTNKISQGCFFNRWVISQGFHRCQRREILFSFVCALESFAWLIVRKRHLHILTHTVWGEKPLTIPTQLEFPTWSTFRWNLRSEMGQLFPAVVSGAQYVPWLVWTCWGRRGVATCTADSAQVAI